MEPKFIIFRGTRMIEGWPEKIQNAQLIARCRPNGIVMDRIRYGDEKDDWGAGARSCHDCRVIKGELHVPGCDVERCSACGGQMIGCACDYSEDPVF